MRFLHADRGNLSFSYPSLLNVLCMPSEAFYLIYGYLPLNGRLPRRKSASNDKILVSMLTRLGFRSRSGVHLPLLI